MENIETNNYLYKQKEQQFSFFPFHFLKIFLLEMILKF